MKKVFILGNNFTHNTIYHISAFYCYTSGSNEKECLIQYSTISDNYAYSDACIEIENSILESLMNCCNFVNNSQKTSSSGLIWLHGPMKISDCCMLENDNEHFLFFLSYDNTIIEIINCTISEDMLTNANNAALINTESWSPNKGTFKFTMKFSNFKYCEAPIYTRNAQSSMKFHNIFIKYFTSIALGSQR